MSDEKSPVAEKIERILDKVTPESLNPKVKLVVLLDVDNTLINNDKVKADAEKGMLKLIGEEKVARFWQFYEQIRVENDVVDIPLTLKRIRPEITDTEVFHHLYRLWHDFPYCDYIYPGVFEALAHLRNFSRPAILSDGDPSFQLRKIVTTGLARAVNGDVFIYAHKQNHLEDIELGLPADHYVMVEDKPSLLTLLKEYFGEKITTVLVKQGKYANDPNQLAQSNPEITLPAIADLAKLQEKDLLPG